MVPTSEEQSTTTDGNVSPADTTPYYPSGSAPQSLARTGSDLRPLATLGLVLVLLGGVLVFRRRAMLRA